MENSERTHRNLLVWKQAVDLAVRVIVLSNAFPPSSGFVLRDQMQRSAISVPSNIAEGSGRRTKKDFLAFLRIARGSLRELDTQVEIASRIGALDTKQAEEILEACNSVGRLLSRLIKSLQHPAGEP
jgi:four helix bundle protein